MNYCLGVLALAAVAFFPPIGIGLAQQAPALESKRFELSDDDFIKPRAREDVFHLSISVELPKDLQAVASIPSTFELKSGRVFGHISYGKRKLGKEEPEMVCRWYMRNWLEGEDWNAPNTDHFKLVSFVFDNQGCTLLMQESRKGFLYGVAVAQTKHCDVCNITLELNSIDRKNNPHFESFWNKSVASLKAAAQTVK